MTTQCVIASLIGSAIGLQKMPILVKKKIIFSDEAHFDLGGYVNKQNCCIWGTIGIIGPFFSENKQGEAITVNGHRYGAMLKEFLFTKIEEEDIGNIWFQQDESTCHTVELRFVIVGLLLMGCRQR